MIRFSAFFITFSKWENLFCYFIIYEYFEKFREINLFHTVQSKTLPIQYSRNNVKMKESLEFLQNWTLKVNNHFVLKKKSFSFQKLDFFYIDSLQV